MNGPGPSFDTFSLQLPGIVLHHVAQHLTITRDYQIKPFNVIDNIDFRLILVNPNDTPTHGTDNTSQLSNKDLHTRDLQSGTNNQKTVGFSSDILL
ncbi:hypothetical protein WICPIJ_003698 [Wickerhamomyces pijperi]|uniref:Uncharacterized protein n=1 Tax=Wickerhamomyces pijperi TaxID=599730 RepID=A0A9P8Q7E1_WICPI|nr:hypothetical protein WICPIJ_003698 [Wickerhamomyces pijperi]